MLRVLQPVARYGVALLPVAAATAAILLLREGEAAEGFFLVIALVVWILAELQRKQTELRRVVDGIPAMAWGILPDGRLEFLNKRWLDYSGMSLAEALVGANRAVHPDDLPIATRSWERMRLAGEAYDQELRLRRADGEYRWFLVRTVPLKDARGNVVRWYGISTDIEDRRRAEQAALESRRLLDQVLATLPVGAIVVNRTGDVVTANTAARRIWGGELIASGAERRAKVKAFWHETGVPLAPEELPSVRAMSGGAPVLNEVIDIEAFDGRRKTIENSAAPIRSGDAIVGAVVVNQDVTERVRAEKRQRALAAQTQRLSRRLLSVQEEERRHLSRELHDEFGQVLAAISLQIQVAKSVAGDAAAPSLEAAAALVQRAGEQVRGLALQLRPTMLETAGIDATLRWLAHEHERTTGISVTVSGHANDLGYETAIGCFRVAQEALTNVVRHAEARNAWIEVSRGRGALRLLVRDDGIGFDVPGALARAAEAGRMGLLGMRERVELLGGTLQLQSKPGEGTTIRAELPAPDGAGE